MARAATCRISSDSLVGGLDTWESSGGLDGGLGSTEFVGGTLLSGSCWSGCVSPLNNCEGKGWRLWTRFGDKISASLEFLVIALYVVSVGRSAGDEESSMSRRKSSVARTQRKKNRQVTWAQRQLLVAWAVFFVLYFSCRHAMKFCN
jgi:hypothetical protein